MSIRTPLVIVALAAVAASTATGASPALAQSVPKGHLVVAGGGEMPDRIFARAFTADTPETRRKARTMMSAVYVLILLVGVAFCYSAFSSTPVQYRTLVQSIIFLALGAGGLIVGRSRR